jgi:hypothetical protein
LRLHAQYLVGRHRQNEIDRLAFDHLAGVERVRECQPKEPDHARSAFFTEHVPVPQRIADMSGFRVEPDIPGQVDIPHFGERRDIDLD